MASRPSSGFATRSVPLIRDCRSPAEQSSLIPSNSIRKSRFSKSNVCQYFTGEGDGWLASGVITHRMRRVCNGGIRRNRYVRFARVVATTDVVRHRSYRTDQLRRAFGSNGPTGHIRACTRRSRPGDYRSRIDAPGRLVGFVFDQAGLRASVSRCLLSDYYVVAYDACSVCRPARALHKWRLPVSLKLWLASSQQQFPMDKGTEKAIAA